MKISNLENVAISLRKLEIVLYVGYNIIGEINGNKR